MHVLNSFLPFHGNVIPFPSLNQLEGTLLQCPKGLIGFKEHQQFHLQDDADSFYSLLSSVQNPNIRFLLYRLPWDFYPPKDLVEGLIYEKIDAIDDVLYSIVSIEKDQPTLNLQAPLVRKDETIWQIVLNASYSLDYPIDSL